MSLSRYLCRVIRIPTAAEPLMKSPPFPKGDVCGADRGILLEMPRADPWPFGPLQLSSPPWGAPSQGRSLLLRQHHVICVESLGFLPPLCGKCTPSVSFADISLKGGDKAWACGALISFHQLSSPR